MTDYAATRRDFGWELPEQFNFGVDVVDTLAADPAREALIWCNADGEERRLSFADIARSSDRLANGLAAGGIAKGDRVVVMLPRIPDWQIAMIACLKLGAVAVPCIEMLTARDVIYRVQHSEARGIITTPANADKIATGCDTLVLRIAVGDAPPGCWQSYARVMEDSPADFQAASVALDDPTVIYYTSGTTGAPKGVVHGAGALFAWRYTARYWLDLGPRDLMWCTADTGWSKAGTSVLFGPWSCGARVLLYDGPFDASRRLELLERYRVSVFCAAATELRQLVFEDTAGRDLSALRRTVSAGETLNPEIATRWSELTGVPCHEAYGQTESLMSIHNYPATPYKAGSAGLPLPGYEVAILDEHGARQPVGKPGILAIRQPNPNMLLGYWHEPERLAAQMVRNHEGEWFLSGDAAHVDADGYVFFNGRGRRHHQLGRLPHRTDRGGECPDRASRGARERGGIEPGSGPRRGGEGLRGAGGGLPGIRCPGGGASRSLQAHHRPVQVPARHRLRRGSAQERGRQAAAREVARGGMGGARLRSLSARHPVHTHER